MIKTEKEYSTIVERVEELLKIEENIESSDSNGYVELNLLSDWVAEFEEQYYPIKKPVLKDVIKMRMLEMNLNQTSLSELLGVNKSRISDLLNGKSEISIKIARELNIKLNIDADIILGV